MLYLSRHAQKPNARYRIFSRWWLLYKEMLHRKMKKLIQIIFVTIIFLSSCKKDLPPATQTGANTFGMYVNGVLWIPTAPCALCPSGSASIQFYNSLAKGLLAVSAKKGDEELFFYVNTHYAIGNYPINKIFYNAPMQDSCYYYTRYSINSNCYSYRLIDSTKSGINITKLDTINKIVSGTFFMTLSNFQGGQMNITEGRFDGKYY